MGEVKSGPGTLRVRTALTAAIAASESSDPSRLQYVEVELELLDAATNERLAAAVDAKGWTGRPRRPVRSMSKPERRSGIGPNGPASGLRRCEAWTVSTASRRVLDEPERRIVPGRG